MEHGVEKAVDRQLRAGDECERTPRTVRARAAAGERLGLRVGEVEVVTRPDSCGACASSRERDLPKPTESNITAATATTLHRPAPNKPNPLLRPRLRDRDLHRSRWSAASSPMTWSPARGKRHASSAPVAARRPLRALPPSAMPPLGSRAPHTSFDQYSEGARASPVHALVLPGSAQVQQQPAASASRD